MTTTRTVLPPAIRHADGVVYAGSAGIYALDASSGELLRRYPGHGGAFAVGSGLLVTARHTEGGVVRALLLDAGVEVWRCEVGARPSVAPVIAGDTVYVGVLEGWLLALSVTDGALRWRYDCGQCGSPTAAGGRVYIAPAVNAPGTPMVVALDAATGRVMWRAAIPALTSRVLTIAGDLIVAATHVGCVALDVRDGVTRWSHPIEGNMIGSPVVAEGRVYLSNALWGHRWGEDGRLVERHEAFALALDAASGARIWQTQIGRESDVQRLTAPAVSGDTIYLGADDGHLDALDASDGSVRWRYQTGGQRVSTPVIVDGAVYVGANDGFVYALDARTAELRWRTFTDTALVAVARVSVVAGSIGGAQPEQK